MELPLYQVFPTSQIKHARCYSFVSWNFSLLCVNNWCDIYFSSPWILGYGQKEPRRESWLVTGHMQKVSLAAESNPFHKFEIHWTWTPEIKSVLWCWLNSMPLKICFISVSVQQPPPMWSTKTFFTHLSWDSDLKMSLTLHLTTLSEKKSLQKTSQHVDLLICTGRWTQLWKLSSVKVHIPTSNEGTFLLLHTSLPTFDVVSVFWTLAILTGL